jgi:hypothetical protein
VCGGDVHALDAARVLGDAHVLDAFHVLDAGQTMDAALDHFFHTFVSPIRYRILDTNIE